MARTGAEITGAKWVERANKASPPHLQLQLHATVHVSVGLTSELMSQLEQSVGLVIGDKSDVARLIGKELNVTIVEEDMSLSVQNWQVLRVTAIHGPTPTEKL